MAFSTTTISSESTQSVSQGFEMENLESRQLLSVSLPTNHGGAAAGGSKLSATLVSKAVLAKAILPKSNFAKLSFAPIVLKPFFVEPKVDSNVKSWVNVSGDPLFAAGGPSPNDIAQGQVGDCYFLASLSAVAAHDPSLIKKDITQRADGTYDVSFHKTNGTIVDEHVDGSLPVNAYGGLEYAQLGTSNCTWVAIMEKAFTYFRNPSIAAAYSTTDTGWGSEALADVGGTVTEVLPSVTSSSDLFNKLAWSMLFNAATDFCTKGTGSGPLVHGHVYSVVSIQSVAGVQEIEVRNPWGYNPNFTANKNGYGATNDGYMWVTASSVYPEINEYVNANV